MGKRFSFIMVWLLSLVVVIVSGCSSGGGGGGGGATTPPPADNGGATTPPPASVADAIKAADQSGALPALNRDTTVAGPDTNNNGVRDDIDAYINTLPDSPAQKAALRQASSAITNAMLADTTNQSALIEAGKKIMNASACAHKQYDTANASKKNSEMEKLTVNTKARFQAYEKYSVAISGTSFVLPQGGGCEN